MYTAADDRLALNATGSRVDSDIRRYLGSLAGRNAERFCCPSLASIASAAWTSPLVVKERLEFFGKDGLVFPVVKEVEGKKLHGWIVPRKRKGKHKLQASAAGLNGDDGAFLRSCGIMTEE